jgi:methionine biosynthesis protein MetW
MSQTFRKFSKSIILRIQYAPLRSKIFFLISLVAEYHNIYKDIKAQFSDVKLYRANSSVDFNAQWTARLGGGSDYSNYTDTHQDSDSLEISSLRKDDLFIYNFLPAGCRVLELGCGNGRLGRVLVNNKNIEYVGLEFSDVAVNECRDKGLMVYQCDLNDLSSKAFKVLEGVKFDFVISLWCIDLLKNQEELLPRLAKFADRQLHGFWNAGHWSARLRFMMGRFPLYNYNHTASGELIYPYAYGTTNRSWTLKDFSAYASELGFYSKLVGSGPKFGLNTASLFSFMIWPSMRAGRVVWLLEKK